MATTANAVVAFFSKEAQAAEAIEALHAAGFQAHEIGAATNSGYGETAGGYGSTASSTASSAGAKMQEAGSTVAAKTEGVWERMKNFFEGDSTEGGMDGDTREAGPVGVTRGGYGNDYDYEPADVSHSLGGMNLPATKSSYFENKFSAGTGVLVTVSPSVGREQEAENILTQHGGDLGSSTYDTNTTAQNYGTTAAATTPATGQQRIQLLGEVLRVHKDRISRGEVRIRKEVITENQTVQVPVTREELVIERMPATGQTTATGTIGESSEIRIPLSEERASATTETFVREEVNIGKRAIENVEQVGGAVRREELEVEDGTTNTTGTTRSR